MPRDDNTNVHRQFTVYLRQSSEPETQAWNVLERVIKVLSTLALPVILAIVGFSVQRRLQDQTLQREYVTLAVSILQESDPQKASPELKEWAARLLDQNAPLKLPPELLAKLQSGRTLLPISEWRGVSGSIAATPNVIEKGEWATLQWNSFNATDVAILPDIGKVGLSGSMRVSPTKTTTYTLMISNPMGATNGRATVTVQERR